MFALVLVTRHSNGVNCVGCGSCTKCPISGGDEVKLSHVDSVQPAPREALGTKA